MQVGTSATGIAHSRAKASDQPTSLWARLTSFKTEDLNKLVFDEGKLVQLETLRGCTMLVNAAAGPIEVIFGWPDYLEFHSSMTLFAHAAMEKKVFLDALEKHVAGTLDASTTDLMSE